MKEVESLCFSSNVLCITKDVQQHDVQQHDVKHSELFVLHVHIHCIMTAQQPKQYPPGSFVADE